jgi:hypothetical protein
VNFYFFVYSALERQFVIFFITISFAVHIFKKNKIIVASIVDTFVLSLTNSWAKVNTMCGSSKSLTC